MILRKHHPSSWTFPEVFRGSLFSLRPSNKDLVAWAQKARDIRNQHQQEPTVGAPCHFGHIWEPWIVWLTWVDWWYLMMLGCVLLMFFSCHKETIRNPSIVSGEVGEEAHHRLLQVRFPGSAAKRRRGRRGGQPAVGFHGISQLCFWQFLCGLTILTWDVYGDNPYLITVVRIIF